jgi:hypothetical protein
MSKKSKSAKVVLPPVRKCKHFKRKTLHEVAVKKILEESVNEHGWQCVGRLKTKSKQAIRHARRSLRLFVCAFVSGISIDYVY